MLLRLTVLLILPFTLSGCTEKSGQDSLYLLQQGSLPHNQHIGETPGFLVKNTEHPYNRIGTPKAVAQEGKSVPEIIVSPEQPTLYYDEEQFATDIAEYTNRVFRIHFPKVPFSFPGINITAGNNPGLLIIYTYDQHDQLLLLTTLHTCGCYLAFLPTNSMQKSAYPPGWPLNNQWVYGYSLPSHIQLDQDERKSIIFTIESQTHRISDIKQQDPGNLDTTSRKIVTSAPMSKLYHLPYHTGHVPFFEIEGPRSGYVRNNTKIIERILIGWWALDWKVGEDKAYLGGDSSGTKLYTSLKFWAREESDLKNFPRFLKYWGWKL